MTIIRKPVKRETIFQVPERGLRNVIVSIEPPGIVGFRLKGMKTTYRLPSDYLWWVAMKAEIAFQKKEKAKAKKAKK